MLKMGNQPPTVFANRAAAEKAAQDFLLDDDDGWTTTVTVDPRGSGRALVEVRDADGFLLGRL